MPWPVYTETFLRGSAVGAWAVYVVPTGHRAVIRSISGVNWGPEGMYINVQIADVPVALLDFPAAVRTARMDLMAVAYAGQTLQMYTNHVDTYGTITGYLFADPSGRTAPQSGPVPDDLAPPREHPDYPSSPALELGEPA